MYNKFRLSMWKKVVEIYVSRCCCHIGKEQRGGGGGGGIYVLWTRLVCERKHIDQFAQIHMLIWNFTVCIYVTCILPDTAY